MVEEDPVLMREIERAFHKLNHGGLLVTSVGGRNGKEGGGRLSIGDLAVFVPGVRID